MAPHSSTLAWKIHGQRTLVGYSPWGREESNTTERLHFHFSLFTFMHWRRKWQPTPVFLPGESQGQGSLVGCGLWGRTESDTTESTQQQQQLPGWLSGKEFTCHCRRHPFHSWVRKIPWRGNGNPFQYSCLGNPMDGEAWQGTVHGVKKESDITQRQNFIYLATESVYLLTAFIQFPHSSAPSNYKPDLPRSMGLLLKYN